MKVTDDLLYMTNTNQENRIPKLLPYQIPHVEKLFDILQLKQCALDASDTGTGKTYCAVMLCHLLGKRPFIICPKSVINTWIEVCELLGVKIFGLSNYESLKACNYYTENLERTKCPYIEKFKIGKKESNKKSYSKNTIAKTKEEKKEEKDADKSMTFEKEIMLSKPKFSDEYDVGVSSKNKYEELEEETKKGTKKKGVKKNPRDKDEQDDFLLQLPDDVIIIIDEAHRGKNNRSTTSRLLLAAKGSGCKILMLSATITDKIEHFKPFGIMFGFYDNLLGYKLWLRRKFQTLNPTLTKNMKKMKEIGRKNGPKIIALDKISEKIPTDEAGMALMVINKAIFPEYGSRMRIKDIPEFPKNQIMARCYYLENHDEVDKLYQEINCALEDLKNKEMASDGLGRIVRALQKIEMLKVTIFMDLINEGLENGNSVVVFVNYLDTMNYLCYHLNCATVIHGQQNMQERQSAVNDFQSNKEKLIIVTSASGGQSISLHDLHGGHPRMSIISPNWSGIVTQQVFGRIHRSGGMTPCIQKIVYIAKSYEENICTLVKSKLKNISGINDLNLVGINIPIEKIEEETEKKLKKT